MQSNDRDDGKRHDREGFNVVDEKRLRELLEANGGPDQLDLSGATIEGNFDSWNLRNCIFRNADLRRCRFRGTLLERSDLSEADLSGVSLSRSNLRHAVLESADLPRANLWLADLEAANLANTDCQDACMEGAKLQRANLENSNLQGANLADSDLWSANLRDTNLQAANLERAGLQSANLENSNLLNANLEGAQLQGANLHDANLQNSNLEDANLQKADLRLANLMNANLEGTKLEDSELDDTNLQGVNWGSSGVLGILKEGDFKTAERIHRTLRLWYQQSGEYGKAGDYYYWEMDARRLAAWWSGKKGQQRWKLWPYNPVQFMWLLLLWCLAGYGERPLRVLISVLVLVGLPSLLYWFLGAFPGRGPVDSFYYSAVSTAALGYGSWVTPHPTLWAQIAGVIQAFFGVSILALFLVTFTRKMIR